MTMNHRLELVLSIGAHHYPFIYCISILNFRNLEWKHMWHDQGKWVTCRKSYFLFSYTTVSQHQNASFWCKPQYNWISDYRVMQDLTMLKTIQNKGIWTLFLPISQNNISYIRLIPLDHVTYDIHWYTTQKKVCMPKDARFSAFALNVIGVGNIKCTSWTKTTLDMALSNNLLFSVAWLLQSGFLTALPSVFSCTSTLLGGQIADFMRRQRYLTTRQTRNLFNTLGKPITAIRSVFTIQS